MRKFFVFNFIFLMSPVHSPGLLAPGHHALLRPLIVLDVVRPGLSDGLAQVDDGRDDVGVEPVHVGGEPGPVGVASHSVGGGVVKPHTLLGLLAGE